ncbi:MAG: hypothetical protein H0X51_03240 [Parachlamydiaceae bacterium]|nr:hypothetical protein [Parachlamydiaceae bacterium]
MEPVNLEVGGAGGVGGSASVGGASSSSSSSSAPPTSQDEISAAEQVAALIVMQMSSSHPQLSDDFEVSPMKKVDQKHEIIMGMLDNWLDNLREQDDRTKEKIRSSSYQAELEAKSPSQIAKNEAKSTHEIERQAVTSPSYAGVQQSHSMQTDVANGVQSFMQGIDGDAAAKARLPLTATSFVIGADFIGNAITVAEVGKSPRMDASTYEKMTEQVAAMTPNAADFAAQLGLIGAMFMVQAGYQAQLVSGGDPKGKEPVVRDLTFIRNYAKTVKEVVGGREMDYWIRGMVMRQIPGSDAASEARKEQLVILGKVVLLASALAMYYKYETKKITGQEFLGMLDGVTKFEDPKDLRHSLISMINGFLGQLPAAERASLRNALSAYMDKNPDTESMLKPTRLFSGVMEEYNGQTELPA